MRIRYNSPVVLSFALLAIAVMWLGALTAGSVIKDYFVFYPAFEPAKPLFYWRMFSHVAGHESWTHLMSNFTLILLLGPILEEKYGSGRLLAMIAVTALATGVLNALFFSTGLMGASGIVYMFIILSSFTNFRSGDIPLTFILVVLLFLTRELTSGLQRDNVSQFAHILGGIGGSVFGYRFRR